MSIEERKAGIDALEREYGAKVITYVTSERKGMTTQIASDAVFLLRRHLQGIGDVPRIGLYLVSRGGDTLAPWQIVNLIRQYCQSFEVLVAYTAHSAATLICAGADAIYMTKMGTLTPTDPTVANPFNPTDPSNPSAKVGISVEDVTGFIELARRQGIKEEAQITQIFLSLASNVHPLALGNVQRAHTQIRHVVREMLRLHMDADEQAQKIDELVEALTERLRAHGHTINRREAAEIGLKARAPEPALEAAMWGLFEIYVKDLQMFEPFNPAAILGQAQTKDIRLERAYLESASHTDVFVSEGTLRALPPGPAPGGAQMPGRVQAPPGVQFPQVAFEVAFEGWKALR
jgi:ClpP class serine protease